MIRARGFTLLEVLVATAVLGLAVVTLMGTQSGALKLAASQQEQILATEFAQQLLSDAVMTPYAELKNDAGEGEGEYARYSWQRTVTAAGKDRLSRVTITVFDVQDEEVVTVQTLVTAREVEL